MAEKKNENVNTTETLTNPKVNDKELEQQMKNAATRFKDTKTVKVKINKQFQKHVGPTLPLSINGVTIVVPVDGKEHAIPEVYKPLLDEYLANLRT